MPKKLRLRCSHSNLEWVYIDNAVSKTGKQNLFSYIVSELKKIEKKCLEIDEINIGNIQLGKQRQYTLPDEYNKIFEGITKKTGLKDPSTIVSRLIITPLLQK